MLAIARYERGYNSVLNGLNLLGVRVRRGSLPSFLRFVLMGSVLRDYFHTHHLAQRGYTPSQQCRYRWRLCQLGVWSLQRVGRGRWVYAIDWVRLYELAVLGGYQGNYESFLKSLRGNPRPQKSARASELAPIAEELLKLYPPRPRTPRLTQVVYALRAVVRKHGAERLPEILESAKRYAQKTKRWQPKHRMNLLIWLYDDHWRKT